MTSHELARQLLAGPDLPVHQSYNYGDHWRTTVAPEVTKASEGAVCHSGYHQMDRVVDADLEDVAEGVRRVILLD